MYYNVKIFLNISRYFANYRAIVLPNVNLFIRIDIYPANLGTMILFNVEVFNYFLYFQTI